VYAIPPRDVGVKRLDFEVISSPATFYSWHQSGAATSSVDHLLRFFVEATRGFGVDHPLGCYGLKLTVCPHDHTTARYYTRDSLEITRFIKESVAGRNSQPARKN